MIKTLNGKITFFGIIICALTGLIVGAFSFFQGRNYLIDSKIKENENSLNLFTEHIISQINELKNDVKFLSSTPYVRAIMRAENNNGYDIVSKKNTSKLKKELAVLFKEILHAKPKYLQIRYIGFKNKGKEILRVEKHGSKIVNVPKSDLQFKQQEMYFEKASKADPNKVFLSNFSLNREFGKVSHPLQMVLRALIPIHEHAGSPFGFVIINMDYSEIFKGLKKFTGQDVEYYILNHKNDILINSKNKYNPLVDISDTPPDNQKPPSLKLFENLESFSGSNDSNYTSKKLLTDEQLFVFKKIYYNSLNPKNYLAIFLTINKKFLMSEIKSDLINLIFLLFLLLTISMLFSLAFARKIALPIKHLMKLTKKISRGEQVTFSSKSIKSKDEIGALTHTLLTMSKDILKKNNLLEYQKEALDKSAIVAETDLNGVITYVNDKFIEIAKYSRAEIIGQDHRILNSGYHPKEFFVELWSTISKGFVWKGEVKNTAKDGTHYWVDTTIFPVKDENGTLQKYVAIRFDITERKHIEEELTAVSEQTKKAMEIKSNFLANMSHEIRTPLNSIIGLADVLTDTKLDHEQVKYLTSLRNSGDSLLQIVNDILDLSKIEAGQLQIENVEFDIEKVSEEVIEMMSIKTQEKDIELIMDFDYNIPNLVYGDSLRLRQILINLIGNSIKFTPEGHISLSVHLIDKDKINKMVNIEISVSDTGIGISKENIKKIFESFSQADSSITKKFGGTGLGLNIVQQLVQKMGGEIQVDSQEGMGSVFKFTLPYKYNSTSLITKSEANYLIKDKRVLIVDDFKKNRVVLSKMLINWGAITDESSSAEDAISKIINNHNTDNKYDLLFIDSRMPGKDGFELISDLKSKNMFNNYLTIMLTSDHRSGDLGRIKELDISAYIIKPIKKTDLELVIKNLSSTKSKGKVLIVDDEKAILELTQDLLIPLNLDISIAQNANEALSLINNHEFDAVITDYKLPKMNGIDLIQEIRKFNITIPLTVLSGCISDEMLSLKKKLDIYSFINKPYTEIELFNTIEDMIELNRDINKNKIVDIKRPITALNILVADDSIDNRNLLKIYFKNEPHLVDYVENGVEAIQQVETNSYDLVIMDMQMPVMDGFEATKKIRIWEEKNNKSAVPIIALTANALKEEMDKSRIAGCTDYLTKPIKKNQLLDFINTNYTKAS